MLPSVKFSSCRQETFLYWNLWKDYIEESVWKHQIPNLIFINHMKTSTKMKTMLSWGYSSWHHRITHCIKSKSKSLTRSYILLRKDLNANWNWKWGKLRTKEGIMKMSIPFYGSAQKAEDYENKEEKVFVENI